MNSAVISLLIFGFCVTLFVIDKLPMATTAILGRVLMVVFGVCDFKTAFGQFASSTVILTAGVMVIGASISETGLANTIGEWIIKKTKGSEARLLTGCYLAAGLMSAFLTNSAVLAIFIPVIMGLSDTGGKIKPKNIIMPIVFACVIGGASTLVGSTQQLTAQGLLEDAGLRMFKTFDFSLVGGTLLLLGLLYCLFIGRKRGEKIWGDREDAYSDQIPVDKHTDMGRSKQLVMAAIFVCTVILYITEWLPLAVTSTAAAIMCIVTGCITQKKAVAKINWNVVGRLAGCLGLSKALDASGGAALISEGFLHLVGDNVSPLALFIICVLLTQVASEFLLNSTAIIIILPIIISIAPPLGLNTYAYALGITLASAAALSCPLANSTLAMSMTVGYRFRDYFRYSIFYDIIAFVTIVLMVPAIYGLTA